MCHFVSWLQPIKKMHSDKQEAPSVFQDLKMITSWEYVTLFQEFQRFLSTSDFKNITANKLILKYRSFFHCFVCVNRLQCGGSSGSCLAPSCSTSGCQPQEGKPGLRFGRRSGFTASAQQKESRLQCLNSGCRPTFIMLIVLCADLVLLDDALNVKATYISGEEVWRKGP